MAIGITQASLNGAGGGPVPATTQATPQSTYALYGGQGNPNGYSSQDLANVMANQGPNVQANDAATQSEVQGSGDPYYVPTSGLPGNGQGLLNNQVAGAQSDTNDVPGLMSGVGGQGSQGILGGGASPGANSGLGGNNPDFTAAMTARGQQGLGQTVSQIQTQDQLNAPLRLAQRQAQADSNLAETEQLNFNAWQLQNQQLIQAAQLQSAQNTAASQTLASILGVAGKIVGTAAAAVAAA